jgi:hypothetical protein
MVSTTRPPLPQPPVKRKRNTPTEFDAVDGKRKGLRGNAVPPGRYSEMNDGRHTAIQGPAASLPPRAPEKKEPRAPLPFGFSPIAYGPKDAAGAAAGSEGQVTIPAFVLPQQQNDIRAASPNSYNIASALSQLAGSANVVSSEAKPKLPTHGRDNQSGPVGCADRTPR